MSYQKNDQVLVHTPPNWVDPLRWAGVVARVMEDAGPDDAIPYCILNGYGDTIWVSDEHICPFEALQPQAEERSAIDRLNAEADCYRKEAQEARALQRKFYDETVELRKQLDQVTAERDAANQQCACAVQKLDDLRACLKALAR